MPNPRLLQTAERWMNKEAPVVVQVQKPAQPQAVSPIQNILYPDLPSEVFIFSYDGAHKDFAQELIAKSNEVFAGTRAEIPVGNSGEVKNMYIAKRMGLITVIAKNSNLRNYGLLPITPMQDECLLKNGKLQDPSKFWEDLALLLYDTNGNNSNEAKYLMESVRKNRAELGLSNSDLEKRLVVVNPGAEVDKAMTYGVKPIVIPGITLVYPHEILEKTGQNHTFEYGLTKGLPAVKDIGSGKRTLYMPSETQDIGLRVLFRYWGLDLYARDWVLASSSEAGRLSFAPQGRSPKK